MRINIVCLSLADLQAVSCIFVVNGPCLHFLVVVLLSVQNGGPPVGPELLDEERRFVRTARDLARVSFTDNINT